MKESEIKIRVSNETKNTFKKICEFKGISMSNRIIKRITEDVNEYNKIGVYIQKKQLNLFLLRTVINKILIEFHFEKFNNITLKDEIEKNIKKYLSFEVKIGDIKINDNILHGEIFCKTDNNENWVSLSYSLSNINDPF